MTVIVEATMIRRFLSKPGFAGAMFVMLATVAEAQVEQIHPQTGAGGPIVIAVLADNFQASEMQDFKEAAANFFTHGVLADTFYGSRSSAFTVKTVFKAVTAPGTSNYGFALGASADTNCSVKWNQNGVDTATAVDAAVPAPASTSASVTAPPYTHIVVIGNYNYNFGCQVDNWTYVAIGAVGQQTLHHELGHLIGGLFDEFSLPQNQNLTSPDAPIDGLNCRTISGTTPPNWGVSGAGSLPGCALYGKDIVHAFPECRMGAHGLAFCEVCHSQMNIAIDCWEHPERRPAQCNPDLPPVNTANTRPAPVIAHARPLPLPANVRVLSAGFNLTELFQAPQAETLRLLVRVTSKPSGPIKVLSVKDSNARHVPMLRRTGNFVYEVSEAGRILSVGVLPGNPFEVHAHNGGVNEHKANATSTATFTLAIPNETRTRVTGATRAVEIAFYKLTPQAGYEPITPSRLNDLKASKRATEYARLRPNELRDQINALSAASP